MFSGCHGWISRRSPCLAWGASLSSKASPAHGTYSSSARSATDYGLKVFEISNANAASALDYFVHLFGSKSATDVYTLSAAQARKAFDTASDQNKELWALAQKLATETGEPIRKRFTKVLHQAG